MLTNNCRKKCVQSKLLTIKFVKKSHLKTVLPNKSLKILSRGITKQSNEVTSNEYRCNGKPSKGKKFRRVKNFKIVF